MPGDDIGLDEKRVYADSEKTTTLFVAAGVGLARVSVSGDIVGEFTLERRGTATDVASGGGRLAVAADEDVLVGTGGEFAETGFGPADAVGYHDGFLAAGGGRIARYGEGWRTLGELEAVRSIGGDTVAADGGVYRLDGSYVGLEAARDVTTAGPVLAATEDGLYYLANGWMDALEGPFHAVAAAPDGRAHAAGADEFYEREDGEWHAVELPVDETVTDIAYGEGTYLLTDDGTILVSVGDGWRHRTLGLQNAAALAVLHPE